MSSPLAPQRAESSRTFSADRLARLREIEGWHFWFRHREILVRARVTRHFHAGEPLLEIGCGTGAFAERLMTDGWHVTAVDGRPEGLVDVRRRRADARVAQCDSGALPFSANAFGGAMLLDVLEHVDDARALDQVVRVLRPGGVVLVTVPALPSLWSYRDVAAGHRRRYTAATLERVLEGAGLRVVELAYFQFVLLPILVLSRWLGRGGPTVRDAEDLPPRWLNRVLLVGGALERQVARLTRLPVGSSLLAVCVRP